MTKRFLASMAVLITLAPTLPVFAKWGKVTVTDSSGEEVVVKHGLFGKKTLVKDRFGDGFQNKKSIFGLTKDTQVSALGNDVHVHKGLFGFGKTEGKDMFGDKISSNKNPFYRNTNIDLSGANKMFTKYFAPQQITPPTVDPNAISHPQALPGALPFSNSNPPAVPITPPENTPSY